MCLRSDGASAGMGLFRPSPLASRIVFRATCQRPVSCCSIEPSLGRHLQRFPLLLEALLKALLAAFGLELGFGSLDAHARNVRTFPSFASPCIVSLSVNSLQDTPAALGASARVPAWQCLAAAIQS